MKKTQKLWKVLKFGKRGSILAVTFALLLGTCTMAGGVHLGLGAVQWVSDAAAPKIVVPTTPYALEAKPPYTVAIDAGHGKFDTGANGVIKEINLCEDTTDYLMQLLEKDVNYNPIRTRKTGEGPKGNERALVAIQNRASLMLSIHGNCDKSYPNARGFECYPKPPGRLYHEESLHFATLIANEMEKAGHHLRGGGTGIRFAYYFGKQKKMVDSIDLKVREQKTFAVVEKPLCPTVLAEQCFISNSEDAKEWASKEGCKKAATVYYNAICQYFNTAPVK